MSNYKLNCALVAKDCTFVKDNQKYSFKRLYIVTESGLIEIAPNVAQEEKHWKRELKSRLERVAQPYQD